jgi:hypothetical protein
MYQAETGYGTTKLQLNFNEASTKLQRNFNENLTKL